MCIRDRFSGVGDAVVPILYGGLLSVGVAYTLQVVAQADTVASHAALILATESVFGVIGGSLLLGETMTGRGYLGCALMLAGIITSQLRPVPRTSRDGGPAGSRAPPPTTPPASGW